MTIGGRRIPAPRPTPWAGIVFALRFGVPLVAFGAALDLILFLSRGP